MDKEWNDLLDKVCDEIHEMAKQISKSGKMSASEVTRINELVDLQKNMLKSEKLVEEIGYSRAGEWEGMARGHFGDSYDRGDSYANRGEHWVRGHYSRARDGRDYSMARGRGGRRGYSRAEGEDLMEHMDRMMEEAETPREREIIKRFKRELENA